MVTDLGVVDASYVVVDVTFEPRFASKIFAQCESGTIGTCEVVSLDDKKGSHMSRVESLRLRGGDFTETKHRTKFGGERVFPGYTASSAFLWWPRFT